MQKLRVQGVAEKTGVQRFSFTSNNLDWGRQNYFDEAYRDYFLGDSRIFMVPIERIPDASGDTLEFYLPLVITDWIASVLKICSVPSKVCPRCRSVRSARMSYVLPRKNNDSPYILSDELMRTFQGRNPSYPMIISGMHAYITVKNEI